MTLLGSTGARKSHHSTGRQRLWGQFANLSYPVIAVFLLTVSGGDSALLATEVSVIEAFAAWSLVRLIGSIPITPGDIGIVELGLTGAVVGFGGDNAGAAAAVLLFRLLTTVPTLVLGLLAATTLRRKHQPARA